MSEHSFNFKKTIALVGNPNVGKSVIFGHLTGRYANVSNFPGTTVEVSKGTCSFAGHQHTLIDTPGINSLVPMSEEEQVTRDILLQGQVDQAIQVADAKNIRRALLITLQLIEMGIPFLLDLNMIDEAAALGIEIDQQKLSSIFGIPVVSTIAIQKRGFHELKNRMKALVPSSYRVTYSSDIEEAIYKIEEHLPENKISKRSIALMILAGDKSLVDWLDRSVSKQNIQFIDQIRHDLAKRYKDSLAYCINRERMKLIDHVLALVVRKESFRKGGWHVTLGKLCMHPIWGLVVLMGVLFVFYEFVGNFGAQIAVDWFENTLFAKYLNPWAIQFFSKLFSFSPLLRDFFVGEYGMITVALTYAFAIIFPIVTTFFIGFSLIEDSGYLPRLSIMLNRLFRMIGLNGKAVVPMVLGLGCDTMATMSARIMDTKKEKIILTLLLALGVPCSAQLGIILGMLGSLPSWATVVWLSVVMGVMLLVGFLSSKILPGDSSDFIMEIPPLRKPTLINILTKTMARLEWYLKEVVPLFVLGTFILFLLAKFQLLEKIQDLANPLVVRLLDLPPQATEAFLIGFLRRDYGATRFFDMYGAGQMDAIQAVVSLIVITLFVPCLANALMIIKERGLMVALAIVAFIYPFAFLVGGIMNWGLRLWL